MTSEPAGDHDGPTWSRLFERAPANISEATIREVLADHRNQDE